MIDRERLETLCRRSVTMLSPQYQNRRRLLIIFSLVFFILLLLIPMLLHRANAEEKMIDDSTETVDYRSALAANLARLHQIRERRSLSVKPPVLKAPVRRASGHFSKAFQVRQHAPTRVFIMKESMGLGLPPKDKATFLEKSTYAHFANQSTQVPVVKAQRITHPLYTITQGEFIHAILETAINSDLPGMIRAVVARPVYSYQGDHLLIPKGARLIGQYSSQTLQGINRIMVIWQRIILPNGVSVQIDSPGSDALGEAGFSADSVNRHFLQRFGQASLLSLIGAVVSNNNPTQQYQTAIAQSFQSSASQTLDRSIAIKPTLRVNQGAKVIVFVARDLDFYDTRGISNDS